MKRASGRQLYAHWPDKSLCPLRKGRASRFGIIGQEYSQNDQRIRSSVAHAEIEKAAQIGDHHLADIHRAPVDVQQITRKQCGVSFGHGDVRHHFVRRQPDEFDALLHRNHDIHSRRDPHFLLF